MSDTIWRYNPDLCDGDYCPQDCDNCDRGEWEGEEDNGKTDRRR